MPRYKFQREDIMRLGEVKDMIERAPQEVPLRHVPAFRALLALLYLSGARISEVLALKAGDVWIEGDYLKVRIPMVKKRKTANPFGKPWRVLLFPLSHPLTPHITEYLSHLVPEAPLFRFSTGHPETERRRVWKYIKALNPQTSPHVFRHSRLTLLAMRGATGPELQEWAGHSDLRSTAVYLHMAGRGVERLAKRMVE